MEMSIDYYQVLVVNPIETVIIFKNIYIIVLLN